MILEDVDGVGVVKGFEEGTPQEIIDEYHEYQRMMWTKKEWIDL